MEYLAVKLAFGNVVVWEYAGPFDSREQAENFCDRYNKKSSYPRWIVQKFTHKNEGDNAGFTFHQAIDAYDKDVI